LIPASAHPACERRIEGAPESPVRIVLTDVSEFVRIERALRESERWLRMSQEIARIGHYVFELPPHRRGVDPDRPPGGPAVDGILPRRTPRQRKPLRPRVPGGGPGERRGAPDVLASSGQVEQVVVNLLTNAAKATVVSAHGGTISVGSVVGKGSTFRVELPVAPSDGQPHLSRPSGV